MIVAIFTVSVYRGDECMAVTCLRCRDLAEVLQHIAEAYPDWTVDSVREGW